MGTKAIVIIADKGRIAACAHRQRDGYPGGGTASDIESMLREHQSTDTPEMLIERLNNSARKRPGARRHEAALGACYEHAAACIGWEHEWVYIVHLDRWIMIAGQLAHDVVGTAGVKHLVKIETHESEGDEAA